MIATDAERKFTFCEMVLRNIEENRIKLENIIRTDKSKFTREYIVNSKNCHFWANNIPNIKWARNFQYKFGFNVFALIMNNQIRYFIYDHNLDSALYLNILRTVVAEFIENLPLNV